MPHKITISGIIGWDILASDIKKEIKGFKPTDELEIEVNSPGGSVFEGIEISNAIKSHKGNTTTIATSLTASMGSYIMMAGDSKKAHDDATFMIHNASTFTWGDHRELRKTANVVESLTGMLSKSYAKQNGQSIGEIQDLMDEETWLFGDEILNAGFVDEIIKTDKPEDKQDAVAFQKLVFLDCIKKLKEEENQKNDIDNLAAYFKGQQSAKTPAKQPTKEKTMDKEEFLAFLAKNPEALEAHNLIVANTKTETAPAATLTEFLETNAEAKTEHESIVATAKTEASTEIEAGKLSKTDAKYIGAIMASEKYGQSVKNVGIDAFAGDSDMKTLKMVVALADEQNEKFKSLGIQQNQPGQTPAGGVPNEEQAAAGTTIANAKTLSDAINNSNKVQ